jgi:kumamolisin
MALRHGYKPVPGGEHGLPKGHKKLTPTQGDEQVVVTVVVRRRPGRTDMRDLKEFAGGPSRPLTRAQFAAANGADPKEIKLVEAFGRTHGLKVVESHRSRRSVVLRGSVDAVNKAFLVELHDYESPRGKYRGHEGTTGVPSSLAGIVDAVIGLTTLLVRAKHHAAKPKDPGETKPLTPQQVASLYSFPEGTGAGQTIGIYEMQTANGHAGYKLRDLAKTIRAFGGKLKVPKPIDVAIDGVGNSGISDGETGLDVTIASAIAPDATIAVYFSGGEVQDIFHALQRMVHPGAGDPSPNVISISYGWGADDAAANSFSEQEYTQLGQLFQDAANMGITVVVSSGDRGTFVESKSKAQVSYPATDPWVLTCGGTKAVNVNGTAFDEYIWNDVGAFGHGATGGGVSARFPVPPYQKNAGVPKSITTNRQGRGIPDIAGNASENSGYVQFIQGKLQPVGGTSAVAPLYAGLIARINSNLGHPVGFINPHLYERAGSVCRNIAGSPGPVHNGYGRVPGYRARSGWDACTGLGSVNGAALQDSLKAAHAQSRKIRRPLKATAGGG